MYKLKTKPAHPRLPQLGGLSNSRSSESQLPETGWLIASVALILFIASLIVYLVLTNKVGLSLVSNDLSPVLYLLLAHLVGDFVLQTDFLASQKSKNNFI